MAQGFSASSPRIHWSPPPCFFTLCPAIAAIRAGFAYANVHTLPLNAGGEIRGQLRGSRRDHD
jgi:hypothetical protein